MGQIIRMQSTARDAREAVRELQRGLCRPDTELVVLFCSSHYDLEALAEGVRSLFASVTVIGCTTAGEIGPVGYCDHSLVGVSFPKDHCTAVAGRLGDLQNVSMAQGYAFVRSLQERLESRVSQRGDRRCFGFLLIDGLSMREELVARALQTALGDMMLVGGSAGDDLKFTRTWVLHDGAFHGDSAVLMLMSTDLPFRTFKTQHFVAVDERLVVTDADVTRRLVREINGMPAADEYARLIGANPSRLDPATFASSPVVVVIDGTEYVRSIQKVDGDKGLTFYCAIDEGLVLRVARGEDLVANLQDTLAGIEREIGPPEVILACDCILRNLEIGQDGTKESVAEVLRRKNTIGFSTYGEQYAGVHINQTLTGIAIGTAVFSQVPE